MAGRPRKATVDEEIPVTIRFPEDVHSDAKKFAAADQRSFNLYIVRAVKAQNEAEKKKEGK